MLSGALLFVPKRIARNERQIKRIFSHEFDSDSEKIKKNKKQAKCDVQLTVEVRKDIVKLRYVFSPSVRCVRIRSQSWGEKVSEGLGLTNRRSEDHMLHHNQQLMGDSQTKHPIIN